MNAALLAIGDELLNGRITDTNSGWIASELRDVGVEVVSVLSVADDEAAIARALVRGLEDAELVVTTGGLGPTADDLTTACVARLLGAALHLHEPSLRRIEERFRARGLEMPANNRKQALLPDGAEPIPNPTGTAPGYLCTLRAAAGERFIACLPGVPSEMRRMVRDTLLPWVRERAPAQRFASRIFSVFGLTESVLDERLAGVVGADEARLAFRAAFPRIQARVTVRGAPADDLEARLDAIEARVRARLGDTLYAVGDEGLEETVGRLLAACGLTIAVAESCTGGRIGDLLTDVPGSSGYFILGVAAYANEVKQSVLSVRSATLAEHGAVSTAVAEEMAVGARRAAGAALGLSTTGIAGPAGGTAAKPVGTVCVGLAWEGGTWSRRYDLGDLGRARIKGMTAQLALDAVRRWLRSGTPDREPHETEQPGGEAACQAHHLRAEDVEAGDNAPR